MRYPVKLSRDGNEYIVEFIDIPEAITTVDSLDDLQKYGLDALESALEFYAEDEAPIPFPSSIEESKGGDIHFVDVPLKTELWINLHNERIKSGISKAELSEKTGIKLPNLIRILKYGSSVSSDKLANILSSIGKRVEVCIE